MNVQLSKLKEVSINDIDHFYVTGSLRPDGISASEYKVDIVPALKVPDSPDETPAVFNPADIEIAQDLLDKCKALTYTEDEAETDWDFEDICTQDSCGVLERAFATGDVLVDNRNYLKGVNGAQSVQVTETVDSTTTTYAVSYFIPLQKFVVTRSTTDN